MKKIVFLFTWLPMLCSAQMAYQWDELAGCPEWLSRVFGFAIGDNIYVGAGLAASSPALNKTVYKYSISNNTWSDIGNFPGPVNEYISAFTVNSKAYLIGGKSSQGSTNQVWEFSEPASWTQKASMPGNGRHMGAGFVINNIIYYGLGHSSGLVSDFYSYNPATDTWVQKANFPPGGIYGASGFSINGKGYIVAGVSSGYVYGTRSLWEYDPATDSWAQRSNFPGGDGYRGIAFSLKNKGYYGFGMDAGGYARNILYEYDASSDSWKHVNEYVNAPDKRYDGFGLTVGDTGYIGSGYEYIQTNDLWRFTTNLQAGVSVAQNNGSDETLCRTYPNPVKDHLFVASEKTIHSYALRDLTGKGLLSGVAKSYTLSLDLHNYSPGIYILLFTDESGRSFTKKITLLNE